MPQALPGASLAFCSWPRSARFPLRHSPRTRPKAPAADRPLHSHRPADHRPDLRADARMVRRADREGQEGQRPARADLRVRRAEGPEGLRPRKRFRRGLRSGRTSSPARNSPACEPWPICPTRSKATPCWRPSPAKRSSWPRTPRSARRASTRRRSRPRCEAPTPRSPAGGGPCPSIVALGMLDPAVEVLQVETEVGQRVRHARGPGEAEEGRTPRRSRWW